MQFEFSVSPPGAKRRRPPPRTGATSGLVTYQRVRGTDIVSSDLAEVDEHAFFEQYNGQHDVPLARRGLLILAGTPAVLVGYGLALPLGDEQEDPWFIDTVAVIPERQGEGVGARLLAELGCWLFEIGVQRVAATALFGEDRDRRHRWLLSVGFAEGDGGLVAATSELGKLARSEGNTGSRPN